MPKVDIGKSVAHIPRATELKLVRDAVQTLKDSEGKSTFVLLVKALENHWYFKKQKYAGISSRKTIGYYVKTALYLGLIKTFDKEGNEILPHNLPIMDFKVRDNDSVEITKMGMELLKQPTTSERSRYFELTLKERELFQRLIYLDPGYLPIVYLTYLIKENAGLSHAEITLKSMINYDSVKIFISGWSRENELNTTKREKRDGVYRYHINEEYNEIFHASFSKFAKEIQMLTEKARELSGEMLGTKEIRKEISGELSLDSIEIPDSMPIDDHNLCAEYSALIFKRFGMNPRPNIKLARGVVTDVFNEGFNVIFDVKTAKKSRSMGSSSGKIKDKDVHDFLRYRTQNVISNPHLKNFSLIIIGITDNEELPFDIDAIRLAYEENVGLIEGNALIKIDRAREKYLALTEDILTLLNELRNIKKYMESDWGLDAFNHKEAFTFEREFKKIHDLLINDTIKKMRIRTEEFEKTLGRKLSHVELLKIQQVIKHKISWSVSATKKL